MDSGSIATWNLKEGDPFGAGDSLCSVETDKATVDFEAQDDGFMAKILVPAGADSIDCGTPILITVEEEEDVAAFADYVVEASAPSPAAEAPAAPAQTAPEPTTTPPPAAPVAAAPSAPATTRGPVIASPLAHMLAKDMGYEISAILGTGPGGRVIAADVKEFVPATAAVAPVASAAAPAQAAITTATAPVAGIGFMDYPLSESAQITAAQLTHSKQNVPHYYLTVDVSMDDLLAMRSKLNASIGGDVEDQLGVYELLIKAAAAAMKAVPSANASWMDSVVRVYDSVDINVVVGNGDALYTPVIRNVGGRGVKSLSDDVATFVSALKDDDEENPAAPLGEEFNAIGTFTIMNLGMYGIKSCAPIIREPQACALALGTMENRIVPNDVEDSDEIYKESVMMTATLSCDHRVVDGAVGAQWLSAFKSYIENPSTLLL